MKRLLSLTAVFLCTITMLFGCKSKNKIVEVPIIHKEYIYNDSVRYDSVFYHDSVYVEKSDSIVYVNKIKYKYKYKYRSKTDSFIKHDTIYKPIEKIVRVKVQRDLTSKEKFFIEVGKTISVALLIFIATIVIMTFLRKKK